MYLFFNIFVPYIQILRINNWTKNFLIFLPIFSSHNFSFDSLLNTLFIFIIFSIAASSMYIINDYFDYEKDLLNHSKKKRPIASGEISKRNALILFALLQIFLLTTLILADSLEFFLFIILYNLIVLIYTLYIKSFKYFDVTIIAILFLYRVFIGAKLNNLELSIWIVNFIFFLFFGLGLLKRYAELNSNFVDKKNLHKIRPYNLMDKENIGWLSILCLSISTILLTIYFSTDKISELYENKGILYIIPPIFFTYCLLIFDKMTINKSVEDPINYCIKLKTSWIFVLIILSVVCLAI